ncbi:MAG: carbohydrate kinase family protein [Phycisphaerae bacterium]|nr:carbohydrate kinase family protein [Phycisphaerae bacterium]
MRDESIFQNHRLCVVGNLCRDVKFAPIAPGENLFQDGETPTDAILETIGGGGANSALFAAGLGAEAIFAGKVGDDDLAVRLEQAMLRRGVTPFLRRDPATPTGSSVVLNFTNGCRHFVSAQPNNDSLCFSDIDLSSLEGGEHLLRADVWFSRSMLDGGNAKLLRAAKDQGLATSLDVNWDPCRAAASRDVIQKRKEAVREILPLVDLVHGNIREMNLFCDADDLSVTLRRLCDWGCRAVVVHMGAEGAGYYRDGEWTVQPAAPVEKHVNAAGCGDLLSVCMMLLHSRDDIPVSDKLHLANRVVTEYITGRRNFLPAL